MKMKKTSSVLLIISMILLTVYACQKQEAINPNSATTSDAAGEIALRKKPDLGGGAMKIRLSTGSPERKGDGEKPCKGGGECGPCAGICLIIEFEISKTPLTQIDIANGRILADGHIVNSKLELSFEGDHVDNGDGIAYVDKNFFVGHDVSNGLGYNMVMIKKGQYSIDYSTNPFGTAQFDIIAQ